MFEFYLITSLFIIFLIVYIYFNRFDAKKKRLSSILEKFPEYTTILQYHMDRAYNIIYKNDLLIYSVEGMKIDDDKFKDLTKKYIHLVIKFMGDNTLDEFINLYGDLDTLAFNITDYFYSKYENDEIRHKTQENLITREVE